MLVFFIMLVVFFILGVFGFCQIVGNIKYFEGASSAIGIIIWLAILSVAFVIGFFIAPDKYGAMILAYTISFCLSFIVKPDNNGGKAPKAKIPSHIKNREDRKNYAMYQHYIEKSEQVVEELEVLKNMAIFDAEKHKSLYGNNLADEYQQKLNEVAEYKERIQGLRATIAGLRASQQAIEDKYYKRIW